MPATPFTPPRLGVGLVYAPGLEALLDAALDLVDVVEIEPQTFFARERGASGDVPYRMNRPALELLRGLGRPVLLHSVAIGCGTERSEEARQAPLLASLARTLDAPWVSEHLAFNHARGAGGPFFTSFLLPLRQTEAGVRAAAAAIRSLRERLGRPVAVETPVNYLRPRPDEMDDGAFVAAVAEEADCGLLLDLHNVFANERNGRSTVRSFLDALPLERVWEVHVAGGFEMDGFWLDAHSGPTPDDVMALAEETLPRLPNLGALVFEVFPSFLSRVGVAPLVKHVARLRVLWERARRAAEAEPALAKASSRGARGGSRGVGDLGDADAAAWESTLGALAIGREAGTEAGALSAELSRDPGVALVAKLVAEFRAGALAAAEPERARELIFMLGPEGARRLLAEFHRAHPPELLAADEARAFAAWLRLRSPARGRARVSRPAPPSPPAPEPAERAPRA